MAERSRKREEVLVSPKLMPLGVSSSLGSWCNWLAQESYTFKVGGSSPSLPTNDVIMEGNYVGNGYRGNSSELIYWLYQYRRPFAVQFW